MWEGGGELSWSAWVPTEGTTEAPTRPQPEEPPAPAQGSSQLTRALRKEKLDFLSPGERNALSHQDKWLF